MIEDDDNDEVLANDVAYARSLASRNDLTDEDLWNLSSPSMLTDRVIRAAQNALKAQYGCHGLQDIALGQTLSFKASNSQPFVQILFDGCVHWVAVTNFGCKTDEIILLDSNIRVYGKGRNRRARVNGHLQEQICNIMNTESKHITIHIERVQQQINGFDCGLFAVANVQYILRHKRYVNLI